MDRKKFLITGGRLFLLAGITALTGYLALKDKVTARCEVSGACKNCSRISECKLPQAKEAENGKQ